MLKKEITFKDFNGRARTMDFYFHLTEEELNNMNLTIAGGIKDFIEKVSKEKDSGKMYELLTDIIRVSYGEKSEDGLYFDKNETIFNRFKHTQAYSDLIMDFMKEGGEDRLIEFIIEILPEEYQKEIKGSDYKSAIEKQRNEMNDQKPHIV